MGQRIKYLGEHPTSPVRDKLFCALADRMVKCSLESGHVCQKCDKFLHCEKWFERRCGNVRDTFMKPDMLNKFLLQFEVIRNGSGL